MLREVQIDIRRQRAKAAKLQIENTGKKKLFSDYRVTNPESGGQYTVSIKGFDTGDNTCTCPDFKSNTLGTCKHIEAVLDTLKDDIPAHLQKKKATVTLTPAAHRQLKLLAVDHGGVEMLLTEAVNDLFRKHGLQPLA